MTATPEDNRIVLPYDRVLFVALSYCMMVGCTGRSPERDHHVDSCLMPLLVERYQMLTQVSTAATTQISGDCQDPVKHGACSGCACTCHRFQPKRIQRSRAQGWQMPDRAVYVGRPTRWGNPIQMVDVAAQYPSLDLNRTARLVVRDFEALATRGHLSFPNWRHADGTRGRVSWTYPSVDEIRSELAGKDLACWCPPDRACHADVLLTIANEPAP